MLGDSRNAPHNSQYGKRKAQAPPTVSQRLKSPLVMKSPPSRTKITIDYLLTVGGACALRLPYWHNSPSLTSPLKKMLTQKRLSTIDEDSDLLRTVVFSLADIEHTSMSQYLFAFPVEAVEKAIVYPPVRGASLKENRANLNDGIGMMNIGLETVTIVDLRHKFTNIDAQNDSSKFLILFHTQAGELCGLPVKNAPEFFDINPTMIRSIPQAYREVNQLNFVSHMAIVPQTNGREPLQILMLGLNN